MPAGGARKGTGPKTRPIPESQGGQLAQFDQQLADDFSLYYEAMRALALGITVLVTPRKNGKKAPGTLLGEVTDADGETWEAYQQPPDRQALEHLWDHARGRATQRERVQLDPVINIIHHIPDTESAPPPPAKPALTPAAPPTPDVLAFLDEEDDEAPEPMGIQALGEPRGRRKKKQATHG